MRPFGPRLENETYVVCPICGANAIERYLEGHQQTPSCQGRKFLLDQEDAGRKPVFLDHRFLLDDLGIEYRIGYLPGAHDATTQALWVPAWVWRILSLSRPTEGGWTRSRKRNLFFSRNEVAIFHHMQMNPEHQDLVEAVYALGGEDALENALRSAMEPAEVK